MEFRVLGPLEVRRDGRAVELPGGKPRAVLALLLLHANEPVSAERLAVALWGEDAPERAARTVQVYVSRLRRALGDEELLVTSRAGYRVSVRPGELDAECFERLVADSRRALADRRPHDARRVLGEALALWRGPALADLAFEPFAQAEIARLEEQRLAALESRFEADLALGRHAELVAELQRLVAEHPLREHLHAHLMLALYRAGRQADALSAYRHARGVLVEQLGIEPSPELRRVHEAVLAQAAAEPPSPPPAPAPLPAPVSTLFGRAAELESVERLLTEHRARLVTVTGPGGVGKTRLAIEIARRVRQRFERDAGFVSLAAVSEAGDLAPALARALDAPMRGDESAVGALVRALEGRRLLLVLDNVEQLLDGVAVLGQLLAACSELVLLVTSREPTGLAGERVVRLGPLPVGAAPPSSLVELERSPAATMLLDRARAQASGWASDDASAAPVHAICRRLDGLPLALELAAARAPLLNAAELADRLDPALALLVGGPRDAPARHRALRAALEWSHRLLDEAERSAFARLAAFPAGAPVAAAEEVTQASLETLGSLVGKSLIVREGDRLVMLETVREYARECLARDPGADEAMERFATWALHRAHEAVRQLTRADRQTWVRRLDAELPNLYAALAWAIDAHCGEIALRLAGELGLYRRFAGHGWEAAPLIEAAAAYSGAASPGARAAALLGRAQFYGRQRVDRFAADLHAALELYRDTGDDAGMAICLAGLGVAAMWTGDRKHAVPRAEEAVRRAERSRDDFAVAIALEARVVATLEYERSASLARDTVPRLRKIGDLVGVAFACSVTGYGAVAARRYGEAIQWLEEGLAAARGSGHLASLCHVANNLGLARLFDGHIDSAVEALAESLALCRRAGLEQQVNETLLGLAAVRARRGDALDTARLAGAARAAITPPIVDEEAEIWARLWAEFIEPCQQSLGHAVWQRATQEGARMPLSAAIELALSNASPRLVAARSSTPFTAA